MEQSSQHQSEFIAEIVANQHRIAGYCRAAIGNRTLAAEALQRTLVTAWKKADAYDASRPFLPWAIGIARYEVLGVMRDQARDKHVFDPDLVAIMLEEQAEESSTHNKEMQDERIGALESCLLKLEQPQRQLLDLHYTDGLPLKELATLREKSLSAIKVALFRIRKALSECVQSELAKEHSV